MNEKVKGMRYDFENSAKYFAQILAYSLGPVELKDMMEENSIKIIDVRAKEDYEIAHLPCAINIPYADLNEKMELLDKEKLTIVYCYNHLCHLGARACLKIAEANYPVMHLDGGFKSWTEDFMFATTQE